MKLGDEWLERNSIQADWLSWMNNRWIFPKHRFFIWLLAHKRLLTGVRMKHLNLNTNGNCYICDEGLETDNHLFSRCRYSRGIFKEIGEWSGIQLPEEESIKWWIRFRERSATKKKIAGIILATCIYVVWHARNVAKIELVVSKQDNVIRRIKTDVIRRIESLDIKIKCKSTLSWIERLKMGGTG